MADGKQNLTEKIKDKMGLGKPASVEPGGSGAESGATGPEAISPKLSDARDEERDIGKPRTDAAQ